VNPAARIVALAAIGLGAGFLSGLFGVGGGILIVPALVLILGFPQKLATGTSMVAIAPISLVGVISYLIQGNVDWLIGGCLAVGMVAGGALGSWLLHRLHTKVITWIFIVVIVAVAIRMFFADPPRGIPDALQVWEYFVLLAFGVGAGILSGLVGVGGGVILVPSLIVFFGTGDLIAKGASLVAMLPNAVSTSVQNLRRRNADLKAGLTIGVAGAVTSVLGSLCAVWIDPRAGSILFGIFLLIVSAQLVWRAVRAPKA